MNKISVVIPLYNKAQSIIGTLNSVMAQTYRDFEVVVVNDGSTDDSGKVVENYLAKHPVSEDGMPMIRLINKENGGVSSARNVGIMAAQGKYVAFLDGDDLWAPAYLEELSHLIDEYPEVGIYGIGHCDISNPQDLPIPENKTVIRRMVENPWKEHLYFWTGSSSSSRDNLIKVGLFDERMAYGEDIDMWYRLLLLGGGAVSTRCLAFYVQEAENRVTNKPMPLEKHIPFYMEKYEEARIGNPSFRAFFDQEMAYRIYPYFFDKKYKKKARELSRKIDYGQLKFTLRFRMICPHIYRIYERMKSYFTNRQLK